MHIIQGCSLLWESFRLESYVQKFSDCVFNFQEKVCGDTGPPPPPPPHTHTHTSILLAVTIRTPEQVDEVMSYTSKIETLVSELENCEYSAPVFCKLLEQIQKIIDDLNLRSYSNLQTWVKRLDEQVGHSSVG